MKGENLLMSMARARGMVNEWNKKHPIGTAVVATRDDGEELPTKTRSEAKLLGGVTAVIWLEGIPGGYSLDRVSLSGDE
jgi:hypothetical protein